MPERQRSSRYRNLLLAGIGDDQYLEGELESITVALGETVMPEHEPVEWAYFPEDCVVSMVRILEDGSMIEVGIIGFDGMVGIHSLAEESEQPYRAIVQNPGNLLRLPMRRLRELFRQGGEFQELLLRFSTMFLLQVSQTAACNRLHTIEKRLARWLLMMRNRTTTDQLKLTQEFLSYMLGTRVAGVNEAVRSLSLSGLVRHSRGTIEIIDRRGLELAACECYSTLKEPLARSL